MEIIVPIKRFSLGKQRLADHVPAEIRRELCRLMAEWVLSELALTRSINHVVVVTAESALLPSIRGYGFDLLFEQEHGMDLNSSVSHALMQLASDGAEDACVVHSDIPLFCSKELQRVIDLHQQGAARKMSLVSDRVGQGSNLRLCRPVAAVPCQYGRSSAYRHEHAATSVGIQVERVFSRTLSLDLDTYDDISRIVEAADEMDPFDLPPIVTPLRNLALKKSKIGVFDGC